MSTDIQPSQGSEKKHKKHKKHHDKPAVETTSQKNKRRREPTIDADGKEDTGDLIPDSQPDVRPAKKHKKDKRKEHKADRHHHHHHHQTVADDDILQPAAPPSTTSPDHLLIAKSPFVQQTTSFYLPLSPCAFNTPLEGVCAEHISPLLLTYSPALRGVVLAYENARISETPAAAGGERWAVAPQHTGSSKKPQQGSSEDQEHRDHAVVLAQSVDEYGVAYLWLTADFLLFRPRRGTYLEGYVNLQNESMLGLMCYNYFNAGIEREKLPPGWRWVESGDDAQSLVNGDGGETSRVQKRGGGGGGHFVDADGKKVDGRLVFRVEDFEAVGETEAGGGTMSIIGSLLPTSEA